jgi:hypothetical protein
MLYEYNTIRPHSNLNDQPLAPEAVMLLGIETHRLIPNSSELGSTLT